MLDQYVPTSKNMLGAYKRGWRDCINGISFDDNPYKLKPNPQSDYMVTFSQGFRHYWDIGWDRANSREVGTDENIIVCPCSYWEFNDVWKRCMTKNCKWCSGKGVLKGGK